MSNDQDNALVASCLAGDRAAFDELISRHEGRIYNVMLRVTGNREDAMDATQTAFLKAYDNLDSFKPEHRFFSWICRIGVNDALNKLKRERRMTPLEFDAPMTEANPEQEYSARETGRQVHQALQALSPDYRIVIILKHFQGLSYQEMSEVLGVETKTIKSRLFTARRTLRDLLLRDGLLR